VAIGGGGRYLLWTIPEKKTLSVFDCWNQHVAAVAPLVSANVLLAAGAESFFLVYPALRIIHRWGCHPLALEQTAALPVRGEVRAVALGSDSAGPILAGWTESQGAGKPEGVNFSLIDEESLKVLSCTSFDETFDQSARQGDVPVPGVLRLTRFATGDPKIHLRASPRGDVFGLWQREVSPAGFVVLALHAGKVRAFEKHVDFGHLIPGQDGRTVFTGSGSRLDLQGQPAESKPEVKTPPRPGQPPAAPARLLPSAEPAYYMAVGGLGTKPPPGAGSQVTIEFRAIGFDGAITSVELPWEVSTSASTPRPEDDQRFHWAPAADLLVVIPPSDDRLLLRRVRLDEALTRPGRDYLYLASPRAMDVEIGRPWSRKLEARSGKGTPSFSLTSGPADQRVSSDGHLTWANPSGEAGNEVEAVIAMRDGSGRSVNETIHLRVLRAGRDVR
jgi:hypothetical protein